jgi:hypothetical protein
MLLCRRLRASVRLPAALSSSANLKRSMFCSNSKGAAEEYAEVINREKFIELKVDRRELGGGYDRLLNSSPEAVGEVGVKVAKEDITPLAAELKNYIRNRGPLSINEFMTQLLTHNTHGYYINKINQNKIGMAGDFITSPEISPLFGEMIGESFFI